MMEPINQPLIRKGARKIGRPKGGTNIVTREMRNILKDIAEDGKDEFVSRMQQLNNKDYCEVYLKLCRFVIPTLQAVRVDDVGMAKNATLIKLQGFMAQ